MLCWMLLSIICLTGSTFYFADSSVKGICGVGCYLILSIIILIYLAHFFLWLLVLRTYIVLGVTHNINKQDRGQSHTVTSFVAV